MDRYRDRLYCHYEDQGYEHDKIIKLLEEADSEEKAKIMLEKIFSFNSVFKLKENQPKKENIDYKMLLKKTDNSQIVNEEIYVKKLKEIKKSNFQQSEKPNIQFYEFDKTLKPKTFLNPEPAFPKDTNKPLVKYFHYSHPYTTSKIYSLYQKEKDLKLPRIQEKSEVSTKPPAGQPKSKDLSTPITEKKSQLNDNFIKKSDKSEQHPQNEGKQVQQKIEESKKSEKNLKNSELGDLKTNTIILNEPDPNDPVAPDPQTDYFKLLSKFRVMENTDPSVFDDFAYSDPVNLSPIARNRIVTELASLKKNLPCSPEASIFLVYDGKDIGRMRVLIIGPRDTPYAFGFFFFDVRIPENYPSDPPLVTFCNTRNETFQFGPNFHGHGTVCLPFLNTCKGNCCPRWTQFTTLLQVFISIQSLAMSNKIIQIDPRFENLSENSKENIEYQTEVKFGTIKYGILNPLSSFPKGFEELINKQLSFTKEDLKKTLKTYLKRARHYHPFQDYKSVNAEVHNLLTISALKLFQSITLQLCEILKIDILTIIN